MASLSIPFLAASLLLIFAGLLALRRSRLLSKGLSPLERVGWTIGIVAAFGAFLVILFPDLPDSAKFIFGLGGGITILASIIWPERKGRIYPKEHPSNRPTLRFQRFVLVINADIMVIGAILLFSLLYPDSTPAFLKSSSTPLFLPQVFNLTSLAIVEMLSIMNFLLMLRHHIRSLPPKGD